MDDHNIFHSPSSPAAQRQSRVFLSHRKIDKKVARAVAAYFERLGLFYYFDEEDAVLERLLACGHDDAVATVEAIDEGLKHCSHLLGILSMRTMGSWWVPYEIGSARARGLPIAHLIVGEAASLALPEFIRITANVTTSEALAAWAHPIAGWPDRFVHQRYSEWWQEEAGGIFGEFGPGDDAVDEWLALADRRNRAAMADLETALRTYADE